MGGFFVFGDVSVHAGGEEFGIVGLELDEISDRVASGYLLGLGRWKSEMSTVPHDEHAFAVLRNTVLHRMQELVFDDVIHRFQLGDDDFQIGFVPVHQSPNIFKHPDVGLHF